MSSVVSLSGGEIVNERREAFMRSVAASYGLYLRSYGQEPEAIVYVLCGMAQPSQIAWDIRGASEVAVSSVLSLAAVHCLTEAGQARQGL